MCLIIITCIIMKGTKVQTLGARAVAGAWCIWLVAWAKLACAPRVNNIQTVKEKCYAEDLKKLPVVQ